MTCPSCGAEFTVDSLMDSGKSRVAAAKEAKAKTDVVDEADVVLDDDDDEVAATGDDLLDDDDDEDTSSLEEIADVAKEDDDS